MSETLTPPIPPSQRMPQKQKSGHGCLYGCMAVAGILLLLMIVVLFAGYRMVNHFVEEFTDTTPVQLPRVEMTEERSNALTKRVEDFGDAVEHGFPVEPLVLTQDDINGLIQTNPDLSKVNGQVYVTLAEDTVSGQISLPLEAFNIGMLEGRYLNASAKLEVDVGAGRLQVYLADVEVNGKSLPAIVKSELEGQNLVDEFNKDPESAKFFERVERIEIRDGEIVITPRPPAEMPPVVTIVEQPAESTP
ncbi:MAG TPA: hypothetical protein PLO37_21455 [Candidatus Hydrogenedentes bacterium]|nr:hypothetical protein [Candidatus Hydrogenedentota bacterium]HPG69420.1 hypothetical protein [Candidatus Hydrogenedentota bacterium]